MGRRSGSQGSQRQLLPQVFEQIATPHLAAVYNFAYSLTRQSAAAEDLTQETFLSAFRRFDGFQVGTNCKAWLFKICKNQFIDEFRERRRRPPHREFDSVDPPGADRPADQLTLEKHGGLGHRSIENEEIFFDLFGDEVNQFLAELPEDFRRAILLCDVEGFSYQEIAELMSTPIGTVRSRISRARGHLRTRLEEYARALGYLKVPHQDCE